MSNDLNDPAQLVGRELGGCVLEGVLGRGGMGVVYRARHLRLERPVAVKVFSGAWSPAEGLGERLLQEARLAARLEDARIVQVHDAGKEGDLHYIIMQLVPGETLEQRVARSGPLDPAAALQVMKEVLAGLSAAHKLGVIHRDIKPGNIMLEQSGGVKIMDFGLSAAVGPAPAGAQEGDSAGSWDFMPPEQGFGAKPDPRMDLYSFGATYFYALTGQPPYRGACASDMLVMHLEAPVPDVRQHRPEVTAKLSALLRRLMQKSPEKRPGCASEVLTDLSASDLLLDVHAGGSPFVLLPPKPLPVEEGFVPPEASAAGPAPVEGTFVPAPPAAPPPPPPPPPKVPAWVPGAAVSLALAALSVTQWTRTEPFDWLAAAAAAAVLTGLSIWSMRLEWWKRLLGAAAWGGLAASVAGYALGKGPAGPPALETLILAGLGLCCGIASLTLGVLTPSNTDRHCAGGLLAACLAALTWAAASLGASGLGGAGAVLSADAAAFAAAGGLWRWGGLLAAGVAWRLLRPKPPVKVIEPPKIKNWNK